MRSPSKEAASEKGKVLPCGAKLRLKRGPWTPEEDALLTSFVRREGEGKWRTLPKRAGLLRCGKSCRLRWMNYLRPSVKRGQIAPDEEDLILRLHRLLGNRWSLIAGRIPGRTDNEIKNYWNTHLSKRLISQGIDPRTHKPLKIDIPSAPIQTDHAPAPTAPAANPNPDHQPKPSVRKHNTGQEDVGRFLDSADLDQRQPWNSLDSSYSGRALPDQTFENDFAYGSDALFASFLDSLVNNDLFHHNPQNNIHSTPDPLASQSSGVETQTFWERTSVVYSTALQGTNYIPQLTEEEGTATFSLGLNSIFNKGNSYAA